MFKTISPWPLCSYDMYTYPLLLSICFFTGDEYDPAADEVLKKAKHDRPPGSRHSARPPKPVRPPVVGTGGGGAGASGSGVTNKETFLANKKKGKKVKANLGPEEEEIIPDDNIYDLGTDAWRRLRRQNPYRFRERTYTGSDQKFWTELQSAFWDDFYSDRARLKNGLMVVPKVLNESFHNMHINTDFKYIDEALWSLDVFPLVTMSGPLYPDLIRQFFATAYFHDDSARSVTWMTGTQPRTATFEEFCTALGYGGRRDRGFCIHSQSKMVVKTIAFAYPPRPSQKMPLISGMYYYYFMLAKLFRENLVSKSGDVSSVRGYHVNLLYYCKPEHLRKIDGCDFIYSEIQRAVEKRMTPNYAQYVQRLIDARVPEVASIPRGQRLEMDIISLSLRKGYPDVPELVPTEARTKTRHDPMAPSSSRRGDHSLPQPKSGAAKFFENLWKMCRSNYDVSHKSLELQRDSRRRHSDLMRSRGVAVEDDGPEMDPLPYINYDMPPISDDMFLGFDPSQFMPPTCPRNRTTRHDATEDSQQESDSSGDGSGDDAEDEEDAEATRRRQQDDVIF